MPEFYCPINKINYLALITKAYFFFWQEKNPPNNVKITKKKSINNTSSISGGLDIQPHTLTSFKTMAIEDTAKIAEEIKEELFWINITFLSSNDKP